MCIIHLRNRVQADETPAPANYHTYIRTCGAGAFARKAKLRADPSVPRLLEPQNCVFLPPWALDLPWAFVGVNWMANTADHTTTSTFERVGTVRFCQNAKLAADPSVPRLPDRN